MTCQPFIQAFTGSSRFVLDYLIAEVYERQTPELQDFLLKNLDPGAIIRLLV